MSKSDFHLSWDRGSFTVITEGAMCAPATFILDNGRRISPFKVSPWEKENDDALKKLPRLLHRLRGEWACIPFGMPETRDDLPESWSPSELPYDLGEFFHGPGANMDWECIAESSGEITLELLYPKKHPIQSVKRTITGVKGSPQINFTLEVSARHEVNLPIGVHPVLDLPSTPGTATLHLDGDLTVCTYPVDAEPNVSKLAHGFQGKKLSSIPDKQGKLMNLTKFPQPYDTEEIVLVSGVDGRAVLQNHEESYTVEIVWDKKDFPSCNLWISNKGRQMFPWNGRFCAIGIEPVAAPFDLGAAVANNPSLPLKNADVIYAKKFQKGETWKTNYSIKVMSI